MNALPISLVLSLFLTGKVMLVSGSPLDAGKLRRLSLVYLEEPSVSSAVQSGAIQTGTLIEKVVCRANGEQSYALYLPTKYTPERKWPILYAFDPAARGQIPIERFKSAAEEYGWIIAGSNNSRNGPNKLALEAFEAMWQDTHSRFSLDQRRVYTTGFSGGARAAVGLAFQCQGCITGVIASGAGFHSSTAVSPNLPFIYFAAVGTDDFNYPELKELENRLVKARITQRLAVFSGDHEWLPPELAMEAIQWMELQAMKGDRRDKDPTWIESLWQVRLSAARAFEDAGQRYEAYQRYQAIATDFSGLKDVAATGQKAATLKEAREVKKSINEEKEEISKQRSLENQIGGLLLQRRDLEKSLLAAGEFRATINGLINQAKEAEDSSQRRVARRVLRSLLVGAYEQGEGSLRAQDYASAVFHFEIATEIAQGNPRAFFDLACAYALEGQKGRALQALRKAIEKGFNDLESITTNRALDSLRGEKVYIEMVKSLKKGP